MGGKRSDREEGKDSQGPQPNRPKQMRRKRNNTDLSLFYYLDKFLPMSSNEAEAESTTVKNLVLEIFANHYVRKMVFCCRSYTRDAPN